MLTAVTFLAVAVPIDDGGCPSHLGIDGWMGSTDRNPFLRVRTETF